MTEAEWLACDDPTPMLEFVRGKASERKLRLFTCGCCRLIWDILVDPRSRDAVLASEAFVDGIGTDDDLGTQNFKAEGAVFAIEAKLTRHMREQQGIEQGWLREEDAVEDHGVVNERGTRILFRSALAAATAAEFATSSYNEFLTHADPAILSVPLIHDIFGNSFRTVPIDPSWLTFDVVMIAKGAYEDRAFDRLPILADALQDAGCENEDILTHLRGDGPHVRGCWVVDLLLGKS